jgi:hypothetical protein
VVIDHSLFDVVGEGEGGQGEAVLGGSGVDQIEARPDGEIGELRPGAFRATEQHQHPQVHDDVLEVGCLVGDEALDEDDAPCRSAPSRSACAQRRRIRTASSSGQSCTTWAST